MRKRPLGRPRHRRKENIKMVPRNRPLTCEIPQDRDQGWAFVDTITNHQFQ
jgi:hypothetical protein